MIADDILVVSELHDHYLLFLTLLSQLLDLSVAIIDELSAFSDLIF